MDKVSTLVAKVDGLFSDLKTYLDNPEADLAVATEKETALKSAQAELADARALADRVNAAGADHAAKSAAPARPDFTFNIGNANGKTDGVKTLGSEIVASNAFKSFSGSVEIPVAYKTLLTSSGLTGYERPAGIVTLGVQQPVIADLIPQYPTDQPTVRLFVENSLTNSAAFISEGGTKPEGAMDLVERDFPVRKVAVLQPVTDEMLADHPAVGGYLNVRLPYLISMKEDGQLVNGDGTGANLTGILNTTGIQSYVKGSATGASAESNADAIHRAIAKVQSVGFFAADGMVCHPLDWDILAREKDANNQYFGGGPFSGAYGTAGNPASLMARYWGLNVVPTTSIPQGTVLVGSFKTGAEIYRRQGITIEMSNSHGNTFATNVKTIRAEERLALAVTRPKSFCVVTGIA